MNGQLVVYIKKRTAKQHNHPWGFAITHVMYTRLQELDEIRKSGMKNFRNIQVDESNILTWQGLIVPVSSPKRSSCCKGCVE